MRINIILAATVVALAVAAIVVYASTDARIDELEAELSQMDGNLKQFAVPMDDLRQDIAAIHVELDAIAMHEQDGGSRVAASRPVERQYRQYRQYERHASGAMPAPQSHPGGAVHYGGVTDLYDTTVVDVTGKRRQRITFAEPVDEED